MKSLVIAAALLAAIGFRTSEIPRTETEKPLVSLPAPEEVSPLGYQLILDYEVGGGRAYFDRFLARPTWPGAASGCTVGVGYDCGYNSAAVILSDWRELPERRRLANTAGITGTRAKSKVAEVRDIRIGWEHAETVFQNVSVAKFQQVCRRTWGPGYDRLRPNAKAALLSLTFNRGPGMAGPSRQEMRNIRDYGVPREDYEYMARQIEAMVRVWVGRDIERAMRKRRFAEAGLMRTP